MTELKFEEWGTEQCYGFRVSCCGNQMLQADGAQRSAWDKETGTYFCGRCGAGHVVNTKVLREQQEA